jgi:hypothetical protein
LYDNGGERGKPACLKLRLRPSSAATDQRVRVPAVIRLVGVTWGPGLGASEEVSAETEGVADRRMEPPPLVIRRIALHKPGWKMSQAPAIRLPEGDQSADRWCKTAKLFASIPATTTSPSAAEHTLKICSFLAHRLGE